MRVIRRLCFPSLIRNYFGANSPFDDIFPIRMAPVEEPKGEENPTNSVYIISPRVNVSLEVHGKVDTGGHTR